MRHLIVLATPAPISHRTAEENLGLGVLASVLREEGYRVRIIDAWLDGMTPGELASAVLLCGDVLFLGISAYRSNMAPAIETLSILRSKGFSAPIIAGGYGPTFHADEFLNSGFDLVVRGEGERPVVEIADNLSQGRSCADVMGVSVNLDGTTVHNPPASLILNFEKLPAASRDTLPTVLKRKSAPLVESSRGCKAACLFCSIVAFARLASGPNWRERSVSQFVGELAELQRRGATTVKIVDDSFLEPPRDLDWVSSLADEIETRGVKLRLRASVRADRITQSIATELRRAGVFSVSCGIENFSDTALFRMRKQARLSNNLRALEAFRANGIAVQAGHILFDPGTTMDELLENLHWMKAFPWLISKGVFTEMYAAQGTPITTLLERRKQISPGDAGLGNRKYEFENADISIVYQALKQWHRANMPLYDRVIDVVSAPKAVTKADYDTFLEFTTVLRNFDLDLFAGVMNEVLNGSSHNKTMNFVKSYQYEHRKNYIELEASVHHAYKSAGLSYDAQPNPFISA
jgi:anaerobic magnesium-protoporphyrin IX monomethyl ester cyclase